MATIFLHQKHNVAAQLYRRLRDGSLTIENEVPELTGSWEEAPKNCTAAFKKLENCDNFHDINSTIAAFKNEWKVIKQEVFNNTGKMMTYDRKFERLKSYVICLLTVFTYLTIFMFWTSLCAFFKFVWAL